MSTKPDKVLNGKRIGIFGKGGCGKSTVAVLLAKALKDIGYDVCMLDADSTNVGLSKALGAATDPAPLLDYYGGMVFSGGFVTCPVDDPTPLAGAHISVDELPGIYRETTPDGIHLFVAGKMGDKGPGAGCDGPIAKIARDFRPSYADETPVTLVDYKAGFEDSARGNIISLDWIIVVVDPTGAAIQMAINMREMVDQLKAGGLPATAHLEDRALVELVNQLYREARVKDVLFILNRVRDEETERYVRDKLAKHGIEPIGTIHDDPSLSMAWLKGAPLTETVNKHELKRIVEALEKVAGRTMMMKIASVSDDGYTISPHFGRASKYVVMTIDGDLIAEREVRDKVGHRDFQQEGSHNHKHRDDPRGRGYGKHSAEKHQRMFAGISDCQVLLARGMGQGAYRGLQELGIRPILTDIADIDIAVQAVMDGSIEDHPERLH